MNHLDLFSGIGAFALSAGKVDIKTVAFAETDIFCEKVLEKNFPGIPNYGDVRNLPCDTLRDFLGVDLITGGFPCQDLSLAAKSSHKDLEGENSSLFFSMCECVWDIGPQWVVIENVPKILKYMEVVKNELPEWEWEGNLLEAAEFGAYCRRKRAFIIGCVEQGGASEVFNITEKRRQTVSCRRSKDVLPMCLPWKGGPSLERLASCVVENTEANPTRVRKGDGAPRRMDGRRYLALGNSIPIVLADVIMQSINYVNGQGGENDS